MITYSQFSVTQSACWSVVIAYLNKRLFQTQIKKMFIATSTLITHKIQSHIFATMRDDEAELIGPSMGSKQVY